MKSSNIQMSLADVVLSYGAAICGLTKDYDDRITRVLENGNRTRIFIRRNVGEYGKPAYKVIVKATVAQIKNGFKALLTEWTDLGMSVPHAFYAYQRGISSKEATVVEPGEVLKVITVTGTYFGSGHYVSSWRSNSLAVARLPDVDTGFAIKRPSEVTLQSGEYLIQYVSANPGSSYTRIYLCK